MTAYAALLRAMNVGGTGKLPMAELKRIGDECGFANVRTFIASGNLLFESGLGEAEAVTLIEGKLEDFFGKRVPVLVRTAAEMAQVAADNPFAQEAPNRVVAHFMAAPPTEAMLEAATGKQNERLALGAREIYIAYGEDMGHSKLKLPAFLNGTARNMTASQRCGHVGVTTPSDEAEARTGSCAWRRNRAADRLYHDRTNGDHDADYTRCPREIASWRTIPPPRSL